MPVFIVSCLNLKGGVGKTTLCLNLAACLMNRELKVIVIDLDMQRSATRWAMQSKGKIDYVYPVILEERYPAKKFKHDLNSLISETGSELVLIDSPPALEASTMLAALVSDLIIIPVTASPLDFWAAEKAVARGREARKERGGRKPRIVLIPSKVQSMTILGREIADTLATLKEPVGPSISQRVALIESAIVGQTVNEYAANSPSHMEFKKLAKYVMDLRDKYHGSKN